MTKKNCLIVTDSVKYKGLLCKIENLCTYTLFFFSYNNVNEILGFNLNRNHKNRKKNQTQITNWIFWDISSNVLLIVGNNFGKSTLLHFPPFFIIRAIYTAVINVYASLLKIKM